MEYSKVSKEIFDPIKANRMLFQDSLKDRLSEIFPSSIKDGEVDFKALLEELGEYVDSNERYELSWAGKADAKKKANEEIVGRTLKYIPEDSKNTDTTENIYIEGDNLEVLKLLRNSYYNKIKMIYIDPPYNTGNDFIYNDKFQITGKEIDQVEGVLDEEGNRLILNQRSSGKFHSNWLSMMYPRLKQAKDLLTDDGVIFISIDDNELANLRQLCDEIFGEENFIDNIIWKKRYGGGSKEKYLVTLHESILFYAKNKEAVDPIFVPLDEESIKRYYTKKDEKYEQRGGYRTHPVFSNDKVPKGTIFFSQCPSAGTGNSVG
ncbi:site-specific DNA-methyltransferase [Dehalobacter sp. TeCB1]|uniref:site-specific DNA-methyltransferase n=1 Tax=Dehalobacter sp. TeCB1 TaxID=1843715 RepID=UPI00083AE539|nr:site-specific DNA-methyltransferase [Dehalobacter sp. TeCB1]OCZ51088.1 hypothetical protein A7D23_13435 [Dehalobacter sp. TeCB1]